MTTLLHLDLPTGIAGDMTVAAFIDAGVPVEIVRAAIAALPWEGLGLLVERGTSHGLAGTHVTVTQPTSARGPMVRKATDVKRGRTFAEIRARLTQSALDMPVRDLAIAIFARLARAEARIHGVETDALVLHEVGALDAIADITGVAAAVTHLAPARITASLVPATEGLITCEHGVLPLPGPAVLALLEGWRFRPSDLTTELVTPTGAAILATLATAQGPLPEMTLERVGYGLGRKVLQGRPNALRVVIGRAPQAHDPPAERECLVETNLDDLAPVHVPPLVDKLFEAGALDAWTSPATMKQGRPGLVVSAICPREALDRVCGALFAHSTTNGLRVTEVDRRRLRITFEQVEVQGHAIRIKCAWDGEALRHAMPETRDVVVAAAALGLAVRDVAEGAMGQWREVGRLRHSKRVIHTE